MNLSPRSVARQLWPALFLLGSLAFIYYHFSDQMGQVRLPAQFSWPVLAVAIGLQLLYWLLNSWCWQSIVKWCTGVKLSALQGFSQIAMLTLGKYFPGKIWGMVARISLLQQLGAIRPHGIAATISEQFLILHAACITSTLLWCVFDPTPWPFACAAIALASVPAMPILQRFAFRLEARLVPSLAPNQEESSLDGARMALLLAVYCVIWLLIGAIFCCVYSMLFAASLEPAVAARLIVANTIGIGVGFFAIFSPGGLGVREAITSGLLASQLGLEDAVLLCLMFRLWIVIFELVSGLSLVLPHATRIPAKKPEP